MKRSLFLLMVLALVISMIVPTMGVSEMELNLSSENKVEKEDLSTHVDTVSDGIELSGGTDDVAILEPELFEEDLEILPIDDSLELTEADLVEISTDDIDASIDEVTSNVVSDWVEMSQVPAGMTIVETKTQYQYSDAIYSDWSGWSGWDTNRQATDDLKKEESATCWYWYRYVCPHCGTHMHVWNKCYTWAGGCGQFIGSDNADWALFPIPSSSGVQNWEGTGRIMYGNSSKDRWFYWIDASQGYPNGRSETGYRYATRTKSWGPWSDWSDTAVTASDTRKVQTRTMCRYEDGNYPPEGMYLDRSSATITVGATLQLSVSFTPAGTVAPYSWRSSNTSVAIVDSNGVVAAVAEGTATITAYTDSGLSALCNITVIPAAPTSVQLNKTEAKTSIGSKLTLHATVTPASASTTLTWSSSNSKVAKVSNDGVVKAIAKGSAKITVTTSNNLTSSCMVTVTDPAKLSKTKMTIIAPASSTIKLSGLAGRSVTWSSSKSSVAKIVKSNKTSATIQGLKAGTAVISAKIKSGKTLKCTVTVVNPVKMSYKLGSASGKNRIIKVTFKNQSKKIIKSIKFDILQYNGKKKLKSASSGYYNCPYTVKAGKSITKQYYVNGNTKSVKFKIIQVKFSDNTTWKP